MSNVRAPTLYVAGLERLAERDGVSIPEASLTAIEEAMAFTANRNKTQYLPEVVEDIVAATTKLNPGILYTQGLRGLAKSNEILRRATTQALTDAATSRSDEHFRPIQAAFTFLTGKRY